MSNSSHNLFAATPRFLARPACGACFAALGVALFGACTGTVEVPDETSGPSQAEPGATDVVEGVLQNKPDAGSPPLSPPGTCDAAQCDATCVAQGSLGGFCRVQGCECIGQAPDSGMPPDAGLPGTLEDSGQPANPPDAEDAATPDAGPAEGDEDAGPPPEGPEGTPQEGAEVPDASVIDADGGLCIPMAEVCDGADNDCDNEIDEALTQPCDRGCGEGTEVCAGGQWVECDAPATCGCTPGQTKPVACGTCGKRTLTCQANGEYNDPPCEDPVNACGGCEKLSVDIGKPCGNCGAWVCNGTDAVKCDDIGKHVCKNYATCTNFDSCDDCPPKPAETCDGIDNDCDPATTEEGLQLNCGSGETCKSGVCCADGCPGTGAKDCAGPNSLHECGNYDADQCLEWGAAQDCGAGSECKNGQCQCAPDCTGKNCGSDGCGGSCGTCGSGQECVSGTCKACTANAYQECQSGDLWWFDSCGVALSIAQSCHPAFGCSNAKCNCVPNCSGKNCGTDGCSGSCGECSAPNWCGGGGFSGQCGCTDDGSACAGKECGTATNNCNVQVTCGTCTSPKTCGGGGVANKCGCTPNCAGKECGSDGCGGSCGTCQSPTSCYSGICKCPSCGYGQTCYNEYGCNTSYLTCSGGTCQCKSGWTAYSSNGHCYKLYTTGQAWSTASSNCQSSSFTGVSGAHLVTQTSSGENSFVQSLATTGDWWMGAHDQNTEGTYQWVTGETWSYTQWYSGQPNNGGSGGNEDCITGTDYGWYDRPCSTVVPYVCEIP